MSLTADNEIGRLFSLALGEHWVQEQLLTRTRRELKQVDSLASDHARRALHDLESLGRTLGVGDADEMDTHRLGWTIATLAEYAGLCLHMAGVSRQMLKPRYRATCKVVAMVDG